MKAIKKYIFVCVQFIIQGPVVRKPISANPGLKVNREFYFSCLKMLKRDEDKSLVKFSLISNLTGFKIDANPGLA